MKKTIRIIDLLNLIANGEEVPKKIRLFGDEFKKKAMNIILYIPQNHLYHILVKII